MSGTFYKEWDKSVLELDTDRYSYDRVKRLKNDLENRGAEFVSYFYSDFDETPISGIKFIIPNSKWDNIRDFLRKEEDTYVNETNMTDRVKESIKPKKVFPPNSPERVVPP